jgi:prolyl oligopeptidase
MRHISVLLLAAIAATASERITYPKTKAGDHVDVHHGVEIADPYRWLEDANSAETKAWIAAQNAITMPYLAALPNRIAVRDRLKELWNYERYSGVFRMKDRYFWQYNNGLQDRPVLYVSSTLSGAGEVLLDPNKFEDKTLALAGVSISPDGRTLAYSLQKAGSDWRQVRFMDVGTRKPLADQLEWVKFSIVSWSEDSKSVYYSRYDKPDEKTRLQDLNVNQKAFNHKLGTPQSEDTLIFFRPAEKNWMYSVFETEDRKYLLLRIGKGSERNSSWFYRPLKSGGWVELLPNFESDYSLVGTEGDRFFFRTTLDAPLGRVIEINLKRPEKANWKTVIPESKDSLTSVSYVAGTFIASCLKDARSEVRLFDSAGKPLGEVALPGIGRVTGFQGRQDDTEVFYEFSSFTTPTSVYRFDLKERKSSLFRQPKVPADLSRYETREVFYASKDGTRVPMFLTYRRDLKRDRSHPVYLYGYGGFNIPVRVGYSPVIPLWLEMGGIVAYPAIRGGGEYGREWHMAGTKSRKQNVFDDFIAAAEYLIRENYTVPRKIAIHGGSNGGLLVAACMLQRPDLFGAVAPAVGVLDMLRFHKFTIGWGWVSDYGSPDNAEDFKALYAYSPYHNIKKGVEYPPTLITTADHDDRVVPAHSFKFVSALQAAQEGSAPILIRIQTEAGHGTGKPLSMQIEEQADIIAFLASHLGMPAPKHP